MSTETVELTELERRILRFESTRWQYAGAKETAILVEFDMSATRFYSTLNALIDTRAAMAFDPLAGEAAAAPAGVATASAEPAAPRV